MVDSWSNGYVQTIDRKSGDTKRYPKNIAVLMVNYAIVENHEMLGFSQRFQTNHPHFSGISLMFPTTTPRNSSKTSVEAPEMQPAAVITDNFQWFFTDPIMPDLVCDPLRFGRSDYIPYESWGGSMMGVPF